MKRLLIGAAALVCAASPASAAVIVWQGDMFITAVNDATACAAVNMKVGDFARSIYRPKGVGTNGNSDLISFVFGRSAIQVVPTSPAGGLLNGATAGTTRTIGGNAGFLQLTGVALGGATVSPSPLTAGDPTVAISVTVNNMFSNSPSSLSGCHVTFSGNLGKRP